MFQNVDPVVRKETRFIAAVVLMLSVLMQAVFLILGKWDYTVLLGTLWGAALAVGNFFLMGLGIQKVLGLEEAEVKKKMKNYQQLRLLMMLAVSAIGVVLPWFNTIAVLVPQLFPRIGVAIRGVMIKDKDQ